MPDIKIHPLHLGFYYVDQSFVTSKTGMGTRVTAPYGCYFLECDGKKIMIDTGPASPEHSVRHHSEYEPQIMQDQQSFVQLEKRGVKPEEIDLILLTHLHWDHVHHLDKYPNARILVSGIELNFALNPLPPFLYAYENWQVGLMPSFTSSMGRMTQTDMVRQEITEHIALIPTPGHTPGHMAVVLETSKGPYVFAGDALVRENMVAVPERHLPFKMTGAYIDLKAAWKSIETIVGIVDGDPSRVLGSHDAAALAHDIHIPG